MINYVIIGGGIAGTTAAGELTKLNPDASITIISEEEQPLYSRVLLPHYVKEKISREKVFMKTFAWYDENDIDYMTGIRATKIDVENKFVETSDAREIPYDKLLITTGGDVNLLDDDKRGLSYFYTIADADHVVELIKEVKSLPEEERNVAVYGGGFIALEYINFFVHHGLSTSVIMRSNGFWSKLISSESSAILEERCEMSNVNLYKNIKDYTLRGDRGIESIVLENGTVVPAHILGIGIGIHADNALFEDAGIEIKRGVVTNAFLETNKRDIFAAGDIVEQYDVNTERYIRHGNWMNALMQGRAVAHTMSGDRKKMNLVSSYATNLLGLEIVFVGDVDRSAADEVVQFSLSDEGAIELFQREQKTVGAILIGDVSQRTAITNAIKEKKNYGDNT